MDKNRVGDTVHLVSMHRARCMKQKITSTHGYPERFTWSHVLCVQYSRQKPNATQQLRYQPATSFTSENQQPSTRLKMPFIMYSIPTQFQRCANIQNFESNRIVTSAFDSIRNEHNYSKFLNTYRHRFLTYLTEWCQFFTLATTHSNQQNLLLTMVQVPYLLEIFILAHYSPPSTETPTTQ